jgi:arylsulfatase A-like enzyme
MHDNKSYLNNITCIRRYAAELTTIDDGVGEIISKLKALGLDHDTIIVFSGDNGWAGGQNGIWGMGDHTRPLSAFDAEMQVPLIWWQPGKIPAAQVEEHQVSHVNFLATLLEHLGFGDETPAQSRATGPSYDAVLRGGKLKNWDDSVFYEFENMRCLRTPKFKLTERIGGDPSEFYDLAADPGETTNLWGKPSATADAMKQRLHEFFDSHADPRFDLWHDGKSKVKPHVYPKK